MRSVDQHGLEAKPLTARQACALLGVKPQTLYAYVSRGLVRRVGGERRTGLRYSADDVARLKARHQARSGHGPVAAGALRWGEPVLESALTRIDVDGPSYRGRSAVALAREGVGYEAVADWLMAGVEPRAWPAPLPVKSASLIPSGTPPLFALAAVVPWVMVSRLEQPRPGPERELDEARALIRTMAACLAAGASSTRMQSALRAGSVAQAAARAFGVGGAKVERAIDEALVVCADHELNASSFTARVAASAGAELFACVSGALQTMTGPLHGATPDRLEALLDDAATARDVAKVVAARQRRGEAIVGFGHPLYPDGDPRATHLLALARKLGGAPKTFALEKAMAAVGGEPPTLDLGLVAVSEALGLPRGAASGLFALGRSAGWVAHALEQRAQGFLLRPRARYVGPESKS